MRTFAFECFNIPNERFVEKKNRITSCVCFFFQAITHFTKVFFSRLLLLYYCWCHFIEHAAFHSFAFEFVFFGDFFLFFFLKLLNHLSWCELLYVVWCACCWIERRKKWNIRFKSNKFTSFFFVRLFHILNNFTFFRVLLHHFPNLNKLYVKTNYS